MNHSRDAVNGQISYKLLEAKQHWGHWVRTRPSWAGLCHKCSGVVERQDFKLWQEVKSWWGRFSCTNWSIFHWYCAVPLAPFSYQTGGVFPQKHCTHQRLLVLGGVKEALVPQLLWGGEGWMQRVPVHIFHSSTGMPSPSAACLNTLPSMAAAPGAGTDPPPVEMGMWGFHTPLVPSLLPHLTGTLRAWSRRW